VVRVAHVNWSCELRSHGEWGTEAQMLREGELVIGRRFLTRQQAMAWADQERNDVRTLDSAFTLDQDER
jgi:hypothetical protein